MSTEFDSIKGTVLTEIYIIIPGAEKILIGDASNSDGPGVGHRFFGHCPNNDGDCGWNIDLVVLGVGNEEAKAVMAVGCTITHRQHAGVLVKGEILVIFSHPVEFLVY